MFKDLYDEDNGKENKQKSQGCVSETKNINKLQNDNGIAVRACTFRAIQEMQRDITATLSLLRIIRINSHINLTRHIK